MSQPFRILSLDGGGMMGGDLVSIFLTSRQF